MTVKRVMILALGLCVGVLPACDGKNTGGISGGGFDPIQQACLAITEVEGSGVEDDTNNSEFGDTVLTLALGQAGRGDVRGTLEEDDGDFFFIRDEDFWRLELTEGQIITVELMGTRLNQGGYDGRPHGLVAGWNNGHVNGETPAGDPTPEDLQSPNLPHLTLSREILIEGEFEDIETVLEHSFIGSFGLDPGDNPLGWRRMRGGDPPPDTNTFEQDLVAGAENFFGAHDMDFPCYLVPETGTYFLNVKADVPSLPGGEYAVCVRELPNTITQTEENDEGNNIIEGAEVIANAGAGAVVRAVHNGPGDTDIFQVNLTEASIICASIKAYRNGIFEDAGDYYAPRMIMLGPGLTDLNAFTESGRVLFNDPAFCYKLDPGTVEPGESVPVRFIVDTPLRRRNNFGAGDYYLFVDVESFSELEADGRSFTEEATDVQDLNNFLDEVGVVTLPLGGDPVVAFGRVGEPNGVTDTSDWWKIVDGAPGDMIVVQTFDLFNGGREIDSQSGITDFVELTIRNAAGEPIPQDQDHDTRLQATRAILQESGPYFIRVEPYDDATNYCFSVVRVAAAQYETEDDFNRNDVVEMAESLGGPGSRRAGQLVTPVTDTGPSTASDDVDVALVWDRDLYQLTAQANEVVTISAFADQATESDAQASDGFAALSGHGSKMHPRLRIFQTVEVIDEGDPEDPDDDVVIVKERTIAMSSFTSGPTNVDEIRPFITTESVTRGLATGAVTFVAEGGIYYVEVTDERQPLGRIADAFPQADQFTDDLRNLDTRTYLSEGESLALYYVIERS